MIVITYEVSIGWTAEEQAGSDELCRVEFRAPVTTADGRVHDEVLIWIDNMTKGDAEMIARNIQENPDGRQSFCSRCPAGPITGPHEHDALPEERGWLYREMTRLRVMPMREAI